MTKKVHQFEVSVYVSENSAQAQDIADIVVKNKMDAVLKIHLWQEKPVVRVIVTCSNAAVKKLVSMLAEELSLEVTSREAPHYLYDE